MFRVGVIGCGRISATYLTVFQQLSDTIQVIYAVDKDINRASAFAANFPGCGYSGTLDDLLAQKPDAVHILTPHFLHAPQVIRCLEAGCHVLTEKPIAIDPADGRQMIETAKRTRKQLGVISQNRYIPGILEAKKQLKSGTLGKVIGAYSTLNWYRPPSYYTCDWKGKWATEGGGVVIDQAIHSIDLVRYLMDSPVKTVKGHIDQRVLTSIEVEDVADAAIRFENGAIYSFFACNYYADNAAVRIEFQCENGRFTLEEDNVVTFRMRNGDSWSVRPEQREHCSGESYWGVNHLDQIREFYRCLASGDTVPVDPEEALKTLELVQAIYRSSREQVEICLSE